MMYEDYEDYDLEPNRHKKIKKTTAPKTKKSKHKHLYVDCVFSVPYDFLGRSRTTYITGKYCSVCGKVVVNSQTDPVDNAIELDDMWQKTIDLEAV